MPSLIVFTILLGIAAGVMTVFLLRSSFAPARIATIAQLVEEGKTQNAIRSAKHALSRNPASGDLHYLLARAYHAEGSRNLALVEVRAVNKIGLFGPNCPEREFRLLAADLYERSGNTEEALKEYLMLIRIEPSAAEHYYRAGLLFDRRRSADIAASYFRKTLELDGDHAGAHYNLGLLLHRTGLAAEARDELDTAVRIEPNNYEAWFHLGRLMKETTDYRGALDAFARAEGDVTLKTTALMERGSCFLQMNEVKEAIFELERCVRLGAHEESREQLMARYLLSLCYEQSRRFEEAFEQWEKIYEKDPAYRDVGHKLNQFETLRMNDRLKDYLTANDDSFQEICRRLIGLLGLRTRDITLVPDGCQILALANGAHQAPSIPIMVRFLRESEEVPETTLRSIYDQMRTLSVRRSVVVASSPFSREAGEFAENRPIELIGREQLQELLERTSP